MDEEMSRGCATAVEGVERQCAEKVRVFRYSCVYFFSFFFKKRYCRPQLTGRFTDPLSIRTHPSRA